MKYNKMGVQLLIVWLLALILVSTRPGKADEIVGEFEVLVADDFHTGEHRYEAYIHQETTGIRFKLDIGSLGNMLGRIQTGKSGRVNFEIPAFKPSQSTREYNELESIDPENLDLAIIHATNVEVFDSIVEVDSRRDRPPGWRLATLRRILVIIIDFVDEQVECDARNLSQTIWGAARTFEQADVGPFENIYRVFQENSFNQVQYVKNSSFSGFNDVVGPFRINRKLKDEDACYYNRWAEEGLAMALDAGVAVTNYTQVTFVLPNSERLRHTLCRWTGLAHVGCGYMCRSWISDCNSLGVFAHELGHNAGFAHAGSFWEMQGNPIEYGDPTEIMSNQWSAKQWKTKDFYFGPIFRARNGWIRPSSILEISAYSAPHSDVGVVSTELEYQLLSQPVYGEKRAKYFPFHVDGSYFAETTARLFQLTPFHVSSLLPGTFQTLKIDRNAGISFFWVSFAVGNVAFPQHAVVQLQAYRESTQTNILQTIVPYYPESENITTLMETTLWKDFEDSFALRVLRTSDSIMDIQMTWKCERRAPMIHSVAKSTRTSDATSTELEFYVATTSQPFAFTVDIGNMDSDMCLPSRYELSYAYSGNMNATCQPSTELVLSPGTICSLFCKVNFHQNQLPTTPFNISLIEKHPSLREYIHYHTIKVSMLAKCKNVPPKLVLKSAPFSRSIQHQIVNVDVSVKNMDSAKCSPRKFDLSVKLDYGWNVQQISGNSRELRPGEEVVVTIAIQPSSELTTGNETLVQLTSVEPAMRQINDSNIPFVSSVVRLSNECTRVAPAVEIRDSGVSFYVRNTAIAPIRVTNLDSESCPPISAWIEIRPESTGYLQHAIFPEHVSLAPGDTFDWQLAVTTPNLGNGPLDQSLLSTLLKFHSDHPLLPSSDITQNTWIVPLSCSATGPSLGITCPSYVNIPSAASKTVNVECGVAWRNNDIFLCAPTTWNFSIKGVSPSDEELQHYLNGSDLITNYKFSIDPEERFMAGETVFGNVILTFNVTGLYSYLAEIYQGNITDISYANASTLALYVESVMQEVHGDQDHFGSLRSSLLQLGRCFYEYLPTIILSASTGPYSNFTYVEEYINQTPDFLSPDLLSPDFMMESNITEEYLLTIPHGITRVVNWTLTNPTTPFCVKSLYTPVLHPETIAQLAQYSIKYDLKTTTNDWNRTGDISVHFFGNPKAATFPAEPIEVKVKALYLREGYLNSTDWMRIFLNMTGQCRVEQPLLSAAVLEDGQPSPSRFTFSIGEDIQFYTILNLTNQDSADCTHPIFNVSHNFTMSSRRLWQGVNKLLVSEIYPIAELWLPASDGESNTRSILPQTWQLYNFSFSVPSRLPFGVYRLEVSAATATTAEHSSTKSIEFEIFSQNPRSAWDLHAIELKSALKTSIGFDIVWRACERPGECYCPCKYHVYANNVKIATTELNYFPYRYSMTQEGVITTIQVIVEDSKGRLASETACESKITFTPSASPYSYLFILIMLVTVLIIPGLIIFLEFLRSRDLLPLSSLVFDDDEDDEYPQDEENHLPNEVELEDMTKR